MKNKYLIILLLLIISIIGLSNLKVDFHPSDYEINDKTYIIHFKNATEKYGNAIIEGFTGFFAKIDSVVNKFKNIPEKITYTPDLDTLPGMEEWQNANIFQKLWWSFVESIKNPFKNWW